jgi:hypothetical protein
VLALQCRSTPEGFPPSSIIYRSRKACTRALKGSVTYRNKKPSHQRRYEWPTDSCRRFPTAGTNRKDIYPVTVVKHNVQISRQKLWRCGDIRISSTNYRSSSLARNCRASACVLSGPPLYAARPFSAKKFFGAIFVLRNNHRCSSLTGWRSLERLSAAAAITIQRSCRAGKSLRFDNRIHELPTNRYKRLLHRRKIGNLLSNWSFLDDHVHS